MPTVSLTKSYADGTDLTESQLDDLKDSIESALNTVKLDSDNIQTGGIATAAIATSAVTATKLASDSVTTAKILDANVTTAKIADSNVTTAKIADSAVTTAKINTAAVTQAKLASRTVTTDGTDPGAGGLVKTSSSGSFSTTSTSFVDVTNLSATLTTTGRPVLLFLQPSSTADNSGYFLIDNNASFEINQIIYITLLRDGAQIATWRQTFDGAKSAVNSELANIACGNIQYLDGDLAAGTYTWKIQVKAPATSVDAVGATNIQLVAYEL